MITPALWSVEILPSTVPLPVLGWLLNPLEGLRCREQGRRRGVRPTFPPFISISFRKTGRREMRMKKRAVPTGLTWFAPACGGTVTGVLSLVKGTGLVLRHLESLFPGVGRGDREVLEQFERWAGKDLLNFIHQQHANYKIPGQLSYNDLTLSGECALLVSVSPRPSITTLLRTLCALGMGVGVTIAARKPKEFYLVEPTTGPFPAGSTGPGPF